MKNERKSPLLEDGVYFIRSKISKGNNLSICQKSLNNDAVLANENYTKNSNQCFLIRRDEKDNFYTIMALHSHLYLGVNKTEDNDYFFSLISQHSPSDNFLMKWNIDFVDENYFNIKLKDTIFILELNDEINLPQLNEKYDSENQLFSIITIPIINDGLYTINSKINEKLLISLSNNSSLKNSILSKKDKTKNQLFYIKIDNNDGCYSIINIQNNQCLSGYRNSSPKSYIDQNIFYNLDYQKWIISSYDFMKRNFTIELKSNLLRIDASQNKNDAKLQFENFDSKSQNQIFCIKSVNTKDDNKINELISFVEKKQKWRYEKSLIVDKDKEINDELFENNFDLETLELHDQVTKISKNAFINCKNIKAVQCDPKWLHLFPNPSKIKTVFVDNGVKEIKENDFNNFRNLGILELPKSLEKVHQNSFTNIYNITYYLGDPKFLNIIYKYSLLIIEIPDFVTVIPEEALAGCKNLMKVNFKGNSQLKEIHSRAFANCELLSELEIPKSVNSIASDAFLGCKENFKPLWTNEIQKLSMLDNLIIDSNTTKITKHYSSFCNITSIEIPLTVNKCEENVLNCFKKLKYVKCDPKWLPEFAASNIEMVFIQDGIEQINKNCFQNLTNLKFVDIPESVDIIDKNTFENCPNLNSFKCGTKHLHYLDQKKIDNLILNNEVKQIDQSHFKELVNLKSCILPKDIELNDDNVFINCKKLMNVNNKAAEKLINNQIFIQYGITSIHKEQFEGWENLTFVYIESSVNKIDDGTFDDCVNMKYLSCDPKWFYLFHKNKIKSIIIPEFVDELKKGQFDGFDLLSCISIPDGTTIDDPEIFDSCESLLLIECNDSLFESLSAKTKDRCIYQKAEYTKPIFNFVQKNQQYIPLDTDDEYIPRGTSAKDLVSFDISYDKYYRSIIEVLNYTKTGKYLKDYQPLNTELSEITKVCGAISHEIYELDNIILRPVQILVILKMADEVLNESKSHGSIGEIKTGEGKTIIISVLSILLVKYNRTIDIVTSNLQLAQRDQKEQEKYFDLFGIQTGVLYHKEGDSEFITPSMNVTFSKDVPGLESFNLDVLEYPIVYSTNSNYEFFYLNLFFSPYSRSREYDVVLVDEVDNMFIDEYYSPSIISHKINYAFSKDILQIVFLLRNWKTSEIIKMIKYFLPCASEIEEEEIELLKKAAKKACNNSINVDYIIDHGKIVIIDSNTGFKKKATRWNCYIHEMIEIKEGIEPERPSVSFCIVTQHSYFNLYKKIIGVTGTIGSADDEDLLKEGYNVNIFKVPRHYPSRLKTIVKDRPESISSIYNAVYKEILNEKNKNRPVLIIWDSLENANKFMYEKPNLSVQTILGLNPSSDDNAIKNAGKSGIVTIATSAAGRGVDIKLSEEALEAGGLHVIIPMRMSNQRSLEQAAGRSGRQGQPGSVTFYKNNDDKFSKSCKFRKGDDNLVKLELKFSEYIKKTFPWMLLGPGKYNFVNNIFPYAANYSVVLKILARRLAFLINLNPFEEYNKKYQDYALETIQLAWGSFFTNLFHNIDDCEDWEYCKEEYNRFMAELKMWFDPEKSKTVKDSAKFIRLKLIQEVDWEYVIVCGIKITTTLLCVIFPNVAPEIRIISGVLLTGGLEIYHQLQNGYKINWAQVLIRSGGSVVRNVIDMKYSLTSELVDMLLYTGETYIYNLLSSKNSNKKIQFDANEDDDDEKEEESDKETDETKPKIITLSSDIKILTIDTKIWIYININEKKIEKQENKQKRKHSNISRYMPKVKPSLLDIKFIKMAMQMASESYNGKFSICKPIRASETNEIYKPKFYCIEYASNLYVVTRGSKSDVDFMTDLDCIEVKKNINGKEIYFHRGFYEASNYVFNSVFDLLNKKYQTIYFIGHSYGAAVSSVLCLLAKSNEKLKNKRIYSLVFAPAPAMSYCPSNIVSCIFAFINGKDIVPSFSLFNTVNSACKNHLTHKIFIKNSLKILKLINNEWTRALIYAIEENFEKLANIGFINVKNVKGIIFRIGGFKKTRLIDCKIKESQLPSTLIITMKSIVDHFMDEYIKSFDIIKI